MHKHKPNDYIRKERIKDRTKSHQLISSGINPRIMCVCVQPQNEVTIFLLLTDPIQTKGLVQNISLWQLQNLFAVGPSTQGLYNMVDKCNEHRQMCNFKIKEASVDITKRNYHHTNRLFLIWLKKKKSIKSTGKKKSSPDS